MSKLLNRKIVQQNRICAICHEELQSCYGMLIVEGVGELTTTPSKSSRDKSSL